MIKLTKDQILLLHSQLIQATGGCDGVRDELHYTQKELSDIILEVAEGKKGYDDILKWILEHQTHQN